MNEITAAITLNEYSRMAHQNAKDKGFFETPKNTGEMIALMHSELSEALEADRKDNYVRYHSMDVINGWVNDEDFKKAYKEHIKGSFEEEMIETSLKRVNKMYHHVYGLFIFMGVEDGSYVFI